jgi:plastocyanin
MSAGASRPSALSIAAIAISAVAIAIAAVSISLSRPAPSPEPAEVEGQEREFYIFSEVEESIEEEALGIPPDQFSLQEIVVNKGDKVTIHFYNLEPEETEEKHSFTMYEPYEMHHDVEAGRSAVITLVANESGIFEYQCVYHIPTMKGNLVVLE